MAQQTNDSEQIDDGSGYILQASDLQFLGIDADTVLRWKERRAPLGMTADEFDFFISTLRVALLREGLTDCDLRLKGSSAQFFSGPHKTMPWDRDSLYDVFGESHLTPNRLQLDRSQRQLETQWSDQEKRPKYRPFDSMYAVGICQFKSDYDLQLSSEILEGRILVYFADIDVSATMSRVANPDYDFFRKEHIHRECVFLEAWAAKCSEVLSRDVSLACFGIRGPQDRTESRGELSQHYKETDWQIHGMVFGGDDY